MFEMQKKLEARKMPVNRADSHTSGARFVGWRYGITSVFGFLQFPDAIFVHL